MGLFLFSNTFFLLVLKLLVLIRPCIKKIVKMFFVLGGVVNIFLKIIIIILSQNLSVMSLLIEFLHVAFTFSDLWFWQHYKIEVRISPET